MLFGPQTATQCRPIAADRIPAVLSTLAASADYVVVHLPASLSDANRAVVENSSMLALVVERDPLSVELAAQLRRAMESWNAPQPIGTIVVSRAPLRFPISLAEIDNQLGGPALGLIPAESDLCQSAQNGSAPLVMFVPESSIAASLIALAERLAASRQPLAGRSEDFAQRPLRKLDRRASVGCRATKICRMQRHRTKWRPASIPEFRLR